MQGLSRLAVCLAALLGLVACEREEAARMEMAGTVETMMMLPVTTSSEAAKQHFMRGQRAMDVGRFVEANAAFKQAVETDPAFAHAYLNVANTANSLDEFRTNLERAGEHAAAASEAERLLIEITQKGFKNDMEGQRQAAQRLVDLEPGSPRAWLTLASVQTTMGRHAAARASMTKATELAPQFAPAYMQLGNSYLFNEPRDFSKAEQYMRKVVEFEPQEPVSHDLLGDAYRALGQLEQARDAYTRSAELDPTKGLALQQRGHVNSFLGDYEQARADYDAAIALGEANDKATYGLYRALVSVHAGQPRAAIDELNGLVNKIDGMGIPDPTGLKIGALTNLAIIAIHHGLFTEAERALRQRTTLMMEQAQRVGTDEFRRGQQANIAILDGWLAARQGDYAAATSKAEESMRLLEPDQNPRKNEPAHQLLGYVSLKQGKAREAIDRIQRGDPSNIYMTYHLALAHEAAGNAEKARELFQKVASYNFNDVGYALVREDAMKKVS